MARSKRYNDIAKLVDKNKLYLLEEAVELLPKITNKNVDETIEIHTSLQLNEKQLAKGLSTTFTLPHSMGKKVKIVILTDASNQTEAKRSGADEVGFETLVKKIEGGWTDFDVLIASPDIMPKIAKLGRALGPKGLMPSPKNDTITTDFKKAVDSFRAGKSQAKMDKGGNIHTKIAKVSMKPLEVKENLLFILNLISSEASKNANLLFKNIFIKTSMSPAIKLDTADVIKSM